MGSLLSAYLLTQSPSHSLLLNTFSPDDDTISERLLELAHDLAIRLLPAFDNTTTGIPHPRVTQSLIYHLSFHFSTLTLPSYFHFSTLTLHSFYIPFLYPHSTIILYTSSLHLFTLPLALIVHLLLPFLYPLISIYPFVIFSLSGELV